MSFQYSKYKQKEFKVDLDKHTAQVLIDVLGDRLEREPDGIEDKIQHSLEAVHYNRLVNLMNKESKKKTISFKLYYHEAVSFFKLCMDGQRNLEYSYRLQLDQLASKIDQKL